MEAHLSMLELLLSHVKGKSIGIEFLKNLNGIWNPSGNILGQMDYSIGSRAKGVEKSKPVIWVEVCGRVVVGWGRGAGVIWSGIVGIRGIGRVVVTWTCWRSWNMLLILVSLLVLSEGVDSCQ